MTLNRTTPVFTSNGDLKKPVPVDPDQDDSSELKFADPRDRHGMDIVRQNAERAVSHLLAHPHLSGVLVSRDWHVLDTPFKSEHAALYREVAVASHCFMVVIRRAQAGGMEHLQFVSRTKRFSEQQYRACVSDSNASAAADLSHHYTFLMSYDEQPLPQTTRGAVLI